MYRIRLGIMHSGELSEHSLATAMVMDLRCPHILNVAGGANFLTETSAIVTLVLGHQAIIHVVLGVTLLFSL